MDAHIFPYPLPPLIIPSSLRVVISQHGRIETNIVLYDIHSRLRFGVQLPGKRAAHAMLSSEQLPATFALPILPQHYFHNISASPLPRYTNRKLVTNTFLLAVVCMSQIRALLVAPGACRPDRGGYHGG